ncbi:MAG: class I SAM-dependent methyltransferase [Leptospiraceae bacterium]|nr:class I SAM-dependent methyltransferase [Leptospiraceae bacterium]MCP5497193.1 class I SAM-dependent methyltransferase [Leptospiraceae bacterium]
MNKIKSLTLYLGFFVNNKVNSYKLLDSGDFSKLEEIAGHKIIRPSQNAPYKKNNLTIWENPDAIYLKNETGSGKWTFHKPIQENFILLISDFKIQVKLTPFGHIGVFPEQMENWDLIQKIGKNKISFEVLNLFAYSGLSTLAALKSGMAVCHVDSSKGMVDWARENTKLSQLENAKIRWIVDDVFKFIKREIKRKKKYNGFILDPPSFGRGSKGEIWKIEKHLIILIELLMELCDNKPDFIILSCHTTGYSALTLERILSSSVNSTGKFFSKELSIKDEFGNLLPSGFSSYFLSSNLEKM